jgi:putative transposase
MEKGSTVSQTSLDSWVIKNPLPTPLIQSVQLERSSTLVSPQPSKPQTSSVKQSISKTSSHTTSPSQTSGPASTGNAKGLTQFWNQRCKDASEKLWLPIETDCVVSHSSSSKPFLPGPGPSSWFSTTKTIAKDTSSCQKISLLSPPSLLLEIKANEQQKIDASVAKAKLEKEKKKKAAKKRKHGEEGQEEEEEEESVPSKVKADKGPLRASKLRLFPTSEQRRLFSKFADTERWVYNQAVEAVEKRGISKNIKVLRSELVNNASPLVEANPWCRDVPYDVRDEAVRDVLKTYNANFAKARIAKKQGVSTFKFVVKFKSKRDGHDGFVVHSKHWAKGGGYSTFNPDQLKAERRLPDVLPCDSRIIRDSRNRFFICIPEPIVVRKSENQAPSLNWASGIVAIDPGVRCFATTYDSNGVCYGVGDKSMSGIFRLCLAIDGKVSTMRHPDTRCGYRRRLRRDCATIQCRIRGKTDDLHRNLAKSLCETYNVILLPTFGTQQMTRRKQRKINSKTARQMCTLSHYRFQRTLINKAREYEDCRVILVNEAYTSKTCGRCGWQHQTLGGNRTFNCRSCGLRIGRDNNGARNILLRYYTEHTKTSCVLGPDPLSHC